MYSIQSQPEKHLVVVEIAGDYDYSQDQFEAELLEAAKAAKSSDGQFDLLCDVSRASVLPKERAARSQVVIDYYVENGLRKSANIMTSALQQLQMKRVSSQNQMFGYFTSRAEAEAWLNA